MESLNSDIGKYLLEDIKFYKQRSDDKMSLEIYLKNSAEPLIFSVQSSYSMRSPGVLMVEQISYNPPLRTVINADAIAAFSFCMDDEEDEEDEEDDEEGGIFDFLHGRK